MRLPFPRRRLPSSGSGPVTPSLPADEEDVAVRGPVLREPRPASWWIVPAALLVGGTVAVVAWWLLGGLPGTLDAYQAVTARRGAVQTALAAGGGIGAAITVMLAFRRQRHQEQTALITSLHAERTAVLAERVAEHTRHDAVERRVTELYTKAAEQLGSDKAAVRLAGLYALERLAQDNPGHRQTIVNVICAYLRMPYTPPAEPDPEPDRAQALREAHRRYHTSRTAPHRHRTRPWGESAADTGRDNEGEHQVRLAAQRILADHLRDRRPSRQPGSDSADPLFWEGMRLDLTGATLIAPDFSGCHLTSALFNNATFIGEARFGEATFTGEAWFNNATFTGEAWFGEATFTGEAWFDNATFTGHALFSRAAFTRRAWFGWATFAGHARFDEATFTGHALFSRVTFTRGAWFGRATFTGGAWFNDVTFTGIAWFGWATFTGPARFDKAVVTVPNVARVWPEGWRVAVQPDGTGRLEREAGVGGGDPVPPTVSPADSAGSGSSADSGETG